MLTRFRTAALAVLLIGAVAGAWTLRAWQQEREPPPVDHMTVGVAAGAVSALIYVADENRIFRRHGLDVTLDEYDIGWRTVEAMLRGDVDVASTTSFNALTRFQRQPDLRVIGALADFRLRAVLARRDHGIAGIEDLRGKKVGVIADNPSSHYLAVLLAQSGMSLADVSVVEMQRAELRLSLEAGRLDAAVLFEPDLSSVAARLGDAGLTLRPPDALEPVNHFILLAGSAWLREHPITAVRFLRALRDAEAFVAAQPDRAKAIVAERLDLSPDQVERIFARSNYSVALSRDLLRAMEEEVAWAMQAGMLDFAQPPNLLDWIDVVPLSGADPGSVTILE